MGCGYGCVGCGLCQGISKPILSNKCFVCDHDNDSDAKVCELCSRPLPGVPGAVSGTKRAHEKPESRN